MFPCQGTTTSCLLEDRVNQDVQHNTRQDNTAEKRRQYEDPQVVSPLNGPQSEQRGLEVLYQQNALIQQVANFEYDPELRHSIQAMTPQVSKSFRKLCIKGSMGQMSGALGSVFRRSRGRQESKKNSARIGQSDGLIADQTPGKQEISAEISRVSRSEVEPLKERCEKAEFEIVSSFESTGSGRSKQSSRAGMSEKVECMMKHLECRDGKS